MSFQPEAYVDSVQLAEYLGVTRMSINTWRRTRGLPSYKIGAARRYKLSEIDAWVVAADQDDARFKRTDSPAGEESVA